MMSANDKLNLCIDLLPQQAIKKQTTTVTTAPTHTIGNKEVKTIDDKPKEEETVKAEPSSASSYMTREQDKKNNNVNPFVRGTEF